MSERMDFKLQRMSLREKRARLEAKTRENLVKLRKILNPAIPLSEIQELDAIDVMSVLAQQIMEIRDIEKRIGILNAELED